MTKQSKAKIKAKARMAKLSKAKIKAKSKNGKKPKESFWNLPFRLYSTQHKAQIISARIEWR